MKARPADIPGLSDAKMFIFNLKTDKAMTGFAKKCPKFDRTGSRNVWTKCWTSPIRLARS